MTRKTGIDLDKCRAAAALTPQGRQVHGHVLREFAASGRPPLRAGLERIARDCGADPGVVLAELAERDVIAFDAVGEIRAAYPFSPSPTAIQVRWDDGPPLVYAMCAIDALGMSAMLGRPVTITAAEPGTGHLITVDTDHDRATWNPRTAVVFAGSAGGAPPVSADQSCGYICFFTTTRAARAWARRHPEVTGPLMSQQEALRCGIAEFGTLMHQPR